MRGEGEHPSKNHDFLFRAFSGIPVHNRDVDYVQVGQFSFGLYVAEFKRPRCPTLRNALDKTREVSPNRRPAEGNGHAIESRRHSRIVVAESSSRP